MNTENQYSLILADPPWNQRRGSGKKKKDKNAGTPLPYKTMELPEIKEHIEIAYNLMPDNGIFFLWTIDKYLFDAERIAKETGFKLHARMIWNKLNGIPAAFTIRFGHEYLLYMYKGKFTPVAKDERGKIHSVFEEKVKKHSQKPEIAYEIIERLYPNLSKLEMYARRERPGWDCFGDEI